MDPAAVTVQIPAEYLWTVVASVLTAAGSVIFGVWLSNRDLRRTLHSVVDALNKLEAHVEDLERRVPERIPPPWFENRVTALEVKVQRDIEKLHDRIDGACLIHGRRPRDTPK